MWALGCVNPPPAARGSQEAGFTKPRAHLVADSCSVSCFSCASATLPSQNSQLISVFGRRGWRYFIESLNADPGYLGTLCDSWEDFSDGKCEGNAQAAFGIGDYSE